MRSLAALIEIVSWDGLCRCLVMWCLEGLDVGHHWLNPSGRRRYLIRRGRLLVLALLKHIVVLRHRHSLLDGNGLMMHGISLVKLHRLLRHELAWYGLKLLKIRHEVLVELGHNVRISIGIDHILRRLSRMHRNHGRCHVAGLEGDVRCAIGSCTIFKRGWPKYHALAVAFAVPFRLDAVLAYWPLFAALDAAFATCQTAGLSSLARQFGFQGCFGLAGVSTVQGDFDVVLILGSIMRVT